MRQPRHTIPVAAALLVALAACGGTDDGTPRPGNETPAAGAPGAGTGEAAPATAVCLQADRYVADGPVAVAPPAGGDAGVVAGLRWGRHQGCERFVIDLATDAGADASTAGVVAVDMLRELGILRVDLREVERVESDATDARFGGPLVRAAYTVRSPDGTGVFVDLHLGDPAEASVLVLEEPARVVVDLRPGGGPMPRPAAAGSRVVVVEPRPGTASYPLTVTGYARTFEANVVARLARDGRDVHETFTTATSWAETWGHYSMTIPDGPAGEVTLHVGEHSARDGTWEGVEVRLRMR